MLQSVRRRPNLFSALAYLILAVSLTWPLLPRLSSALASDATDTVHGLWTSWWWQDSLARNASPLSGEAVRLSPAAGTWLRHFNVPVAILITSAWGASSTAPDPTLYNALLIATIAASGVFASSLCRELWGGWRASWFAGALYAAGAYRVGLEFRHVELIALASSPLYLLALVRMLRHRGVSAPLLAGVALALSAWCSRGHLLFCAMATVTIVIVVLRAAPSGLHSPALLRRLLLAACAFSLAGAWYALHPNANGAAEVGKTVTPDTPVDLTSLRVVGYVVLVLAAAAFARVRAARPWILLAAVAGLLALGPRLQVAGRSVAALLPYGWVDRGGLLSRLAAPAEFTWLVVLGLSLGVGAFLAEVVRAAPRGRLVAAVVAALALVEAWPHETVAEPLPATRFLRDLSRDGERWVVLDLTNPERQQWSQMLHRHGVVDSSAVSISPRGDASARSNLLRKLEQMNVRFVITSDSDGSRAALALPIVFEGDGLAIFEVPPPAPVRLGAAQPRSGAGQLPSRHRHSAEHITTVARRSGDR